VTPDGRAFITSSTRIVPGRDHHVTVTAKIIKLSARTGRVQQVLYAASARGVPQTYDNAGPLNEQGCTVLSLDPTGQHPLVQCFLLGRFNFGTLASGQLKPLSGIPNIYCARECRGPLGEPPPGDHPALLTHALGQPSAERRTGCPRPGCRRTSRCGFRLARSYISRARRGRSTPAASLSRKMMTDPGRGAPEPPL
jgi:hypothetical protein